MEVEKIKKGEFVKRKKNAKKTFLRGDYIKSIKRYELQNCDDNSDFVYVKKGTFLIIDENF